MGVVSQPTFSVGVGGGPGEFDLRSAMREQPFEDTETYRGFQSFRELRHIGADEVDVNFLLRKLRDEAKTAWDDVYSNRLVSRNTVLVCLKTYFEFYFFLKKKSRNKISEKKVLKFRFGIVNLPLFMAEK